MLIRFSLLISLTLLSFIYSSIASAELANCTDISKSYFSKIKAEDAQLAEPYQEAGILEAYPANSLTRAYMLLMVFPEAQDAVAPVADVTMVRSGSCKHSTGVIAKYYDMYKDYPKKIKSNQT